MNIESLIRARELGHAYIAVGEPGRIVPEVVRVLERHGVAVAQNFDVRTFSFDELLVDDVRDTLLSFAVLKPLLDRKYLIVSFARANVQAQNALLKAVEESLGKTTFFFCVEQAGHIIPTLRSRCIVVSAGVADKGNGDVMGGAKKFLAGSYSDRLAIVEKMTGYISKTQDRAPTRAFLKELLIEGRESRLNSLNMRDLLNATSYIRMQGSSPKAILGHLAVTLPKSK